MDDFGAFKKWRTEFIQQILMAFGSVIGMNIFFLVLPYINNIAFFNIYLIDAIVSVVVMVTGLMIIKSLISFFSGLVGSADALKEGDDIKGDLGKTLATSAKVAVGFGSGIARLNPAVNSAFIAGKGKVAERMAAWNKRKAAALNKDAADDERKAGVDAAMSNLNVALDEKKNLEETEFEQAKRGSSRYQSEYTKAKALARAQGADEETAEEQAQQAIVEAMKNDSSNKAYADTLSVIKNKGFDNQDDRELYENAQKKREKAQEYSARQKAISEANYLNEDGKFDDQSYTQALANSLRNAGGTLAKALLEGLLPALKIDPSKIAGITRAASNKKYDDKGNVTGQYWGTKVYDNGTLQPDGTIKPSEARTIKQRRLNRATTSALGPLSLIGGNAAVAKED